MNPLDKALICVDIIRERKAADLVLFEVGTLTSIADYFLIASGKSSRQVQAIAQHLQSRMKEEGFTRFGVEGERDGHWILVDYSDVVIHLFYQPVREFYNLEGLWVEAPRVNIDRDRDTRKSEN
ncbi:MAG: ribosome silencing factor [Proteobacteria bacterium]|jgi:ribosome-associated protein|nr:ribosome silencing factor [Pseudomonadota bacterium]NOQ96397.1 ribosome silencing factor [Desulfobacterales bacterium]TET54214.1 MAG: ribosome silencing factor [Desulfobacteraceae bacterium]